MQHNPDNFIQEASEGRLGYIYQKAAIEAAENGRTGTAEEQEISIRQAARGWAPKSIVVERLTRSGLKSGNGEQGERVRFWLQKRSGSDSQNTSNDEYIGTAEQTNSNPPKWVFTDGCRLEGTFPSVVSAKFALVEFLIADWASPPGENVKGKKRKRLKEYITEVANVAVDGILTWFR